MLKQPHDYRKNTDPHRVFFTWDITYKCNYRCTYCHFNELSGWKEPETTANPETIEEDLTLFPDLTKDYFFQGESLAREKGIKIGPTPDLLRIINGENNSMPEGGCTNNTPEAKRCGEILPILFILPDGRVRPCTMWKEGFVGDFNTQDFWEIWEGENFKNLRSEVKNGRIRESCLRCPYRE